MTATFSLTPTVEVFSCPHCGETINTTASSCPFCHNAIDPLIAAEAARFTARISRACNDASYAKIALGTMIPFAFIMLIPFVGMVGVVGLAFLKYTVPVLAIRWWVKYRGIKTSDPDYGAARKTMIFVSVLSTVLIFVIRVRLGPLTL